jgi:hypothetical protein
MNITLIALGVHNPGGMPALLGLEKQYDRICEWAVSLGHPGEVTIFKINDFGDVRITAQSIRDAVDLVQVANSGWVIVYFCGHGFNVSGDPVWVLDGTEQEAESYLSIAGLKAAIASHGVNEITIIGDACQSLAKDNKTSNGVLRRGRKLGINSHVDQFFAAIPGQAGNIVHDELAKEWRPVFSTVLADALCNDPPPVSDMVWPQGRVVHNGTLDRYLSENVIAEAGKFGLTQNAQILAGRVQPDNIYRQIAPFDAKSTTKLNTILGDAFGSNVFGAGPRAAGVSAGESAIEVTKAFEQIVKTDLNTVSNSKDLLRDIFKTRPEPRLERSPEQRRNFEVTTNSEWRTRDWIVFLKENHSPGEVFRQNEGEYDRPAKLLHPDGNGRQIGESLVIRSSNENWSCLPYFQDLVCQISMGGRDRNGGSSVAEASKQQFGVQQIMWKDPYLPPEMQGTTLPEDVARYFKAFITGTLDSDTAEIMVAELRGAKHFNPVLGIIACYYYDRLGDVASIRRTASYYASKRFPMQPIPIDIALMCRRPMKLDRDFTLTISLPQIPEAIEPYPNAPHYLYASRSGVQDAKVAGILPVMSAGWRLLNAPGQSSLFKRLYKLLSPALTAAPITSFAGGEGEFYELLRKQQR